jgi:hypothetical protein
MIIHNGDHAEFEREWADRDPRERPDWPLPSFDAVDWAEAFCRQNRGTDLELMIAWFANALMRGYDEGRLTVIASAGGEASSGTTSAPSLSPGSSC